VKVLHLTTHWTGGGSEANIAHNVECLRDAGHDVHLGIGRVAWRDAIPFPAGVVVHRIQSLARPLRPHSDVRALIELRSLLRREAFDVVHTHLAKAGLIGRIAAELSSAAVVHTVHNTITLHTALYRSLERLAARRTHVFVFVGEELRDIYAARIGIPSAKLRVVRSPVGVLNFLELRNHPRPAPEGRIRAVLVSRLVEDKGVGIAPCVLAALPHVTLDVAGAGPFARELQSRCARAGVSDRVTFHGYLGRDNLVALLADAHVLLHVSPKVEGLPQAVVQALAAGIPVVAVRSTGISELVIDGFNGLIAGQSPQAVAAAADRLLRERDLLTSLADGARMFDPSPWLEAKVCRQQLDLVEELAAHWGAASAPS
jgi:glycosyltransferase involved in cell wall biosynthesis